MKNIVFIGMPGAGKSTIGVVIAKIFGYDFVDSDLLILEGMYGEPDKLVKARENKHMTMYEAAKLAKDADTREMWLTHYSPSLPKPDPYMDDVKKIFPRAYAGKDGKSVELRFEEE